MLTDEQIEAIHKALDELELTKDHKIDLSDPLRIHIAKPP